ncbi:MAG: hypothetical protein BAJATHORv1_40359 [Candidatus Thorarchaeota archaeon]|nr:MAG: hypothetical protein BAJATHORv1_40359 [Candidatus Thorarchaeota archaeon]
MVDIGDAARIIYLIGNHDRIEGRTRFQKLIFLLKKEKKIHFNFEFTPYYYGPYSHELSEYIGFLVSFGLIEESRTQLSDSIDRYDYELTEKGKEFFIQLKSKRSLEEFESIEEYVSEIINVPTCELVTLAKEIMAS